MKIIFLYTETNIMDRTIILFWIKYCYILLRTRMGSFYDKEKKCTQSYPNNKEIVSD